MSRTRHPCLRAPCLALAALLLAAGCVTTAPVEDPFQRSRPAEVPVAGPTGRVEVATTTAAVEAAKLRPGLIVSISVLVAGRKEFEETAKRVTDEGTLVLPLLGRLTVANRTLEELAADLTKRYGTYYVNPQVIVDFVRDTSPEAASPWGHVTVLGRVKTPGRVALPATRDLTVSGGIQKAGGFNTSARSGAILVTRRGRDGQTFTRTVDLEAVGADGRTEDDLVLEAGDVIFVPEQRF